MSLLTFTVQGKHFFRLTGTEAAVVDQQSHTVGLRKTDHQRFLFIKFTYLLAKITKDKITDILHASFAIFHTRVVFTSI
jgi:hypothetical protein